MDGLVIGRYRIIRKLGAGGMAEVYEVRHELMNSRAAMKLLLPELSARELSVRRFLQEAQATASIEHPGIVRVYDVGYADGRAYLVMELLSGETLSRRLKRRKRLSLEEAVTVLRQLAGVVGVAHQHGIVHRDLKPDNLFLAPDPEVPGGERVKVLDFGLAKLLENPLPAGELTVQGAVLGTPAFMSPEQCKSPATVDHRADLYAIGCIFYTCLCGRTPFGTGGVEVLLAQVGQAPPPPSKHAPTIPPAIEEIILRLLEKDPDRRLPSCDALIAALDRAVAEPPAARVRPITHAEDSGACTTIMQRQTPAAAPAAQAPALAPVLTPVPAPELAPVPQPELVSESDSISRSEPIAAPEPTSEPEIVIVDHVENLLEQARARVARTMPPFPRAQSSIPEGLAPLPDIDRQDENQPPPRSMDRQPRAKTVEREAMAMPLQPAYDLLEIQQEPAVPEVLGHSALRGSTPTICDGEVSQNMRRTARRSLRWSIAAIGGVGALAAAALAMLEPQDSDIAHFASASREHAVHASAHKERALRERPAALVLATTRSAGGIPAVTGPVELTQVPGRAPDPGLAELDELLRQAERALLERDRDAARARLEETRAHPGYESIDPERAARVDDLTRRLEPTRAMPCSSARPPRPDPRSGAMPAAARPACETGNLAPAISAMVGKKSMCAESAPQSAGLSVPGQRQKEEARVPPIQAVPLPPRIPALNTRVPAARS